MDQLGDLPPLTGSAVLDPWRVRLRNASPRCAEERSSDEPTLSERLLWEALRARPEGWIREYATGPYRLDFYCPLVQLAVEVDGASHWGRERAGSDAERDEWHAARSITTRRFSATQVEADAGAVLAEVVRDVTARLSRLEAPVVVPQPRHEGAVGGVEPQPAEPAVPQPEAVPGELPACVTVLPRHRLAGLLRLLAAWSSGMRPPHPRSAPAPEDALLPAAASR